MCKILDGTFGDCYYDRSAGYQAYIYYTGNEMEKTRVKYSSVGLMRLL